MQKQAYDDLSRVTYPLIQCALLVTSAQRSRLSIKRDVGVQCEIRSTKDDRKIQ